MKVSRRQEKSQPMAAPAAHRINALSQARCIQVPKSKLLDQPYLQEKKRGSNTCTSPARVKVGLEGQILLLCI